MGAEVTPVDIKDGAEAVRCCVKALKKPLVATADNSRFGSGRPLSAAVLMFQHASFSPLTPVEMGDNLLLFSAVRPH